MDLINPLVRRVLSDASERPDEFWAAAAGRLHWERPWEAVFEHDPPTFRWFVGGRTNISYNALDRHVEAGNGGRAALVATGGCTRTPS